MTERQKRAYSLTSLLNGVRGRYGVREARLKKVPPGLNGDDTVRVDVIAVEIVALRHIADPREALTEYFHKEKSRLGLNLVDLEIERYRQAPDLQL